MSDIMSSSSSDEESWSSRASPSPPPSPPPPFVRKRKQNSRRICNLRLEENYCIGWSQRDGMREIIQNFLDSLTKSNDLQQKHIRFHHNQNEHGEQWIAKTAPHLIDNDNPELGHIKWNKSSREMEILNRNAALNDSVWYMGHTEKVDDMLIGKHGEGMKLAVLCLLRSGKSVTYLSGYRRWNFFLRKERDSKNRVLFYDAEDLPSFRPNVTVRISDVTMDMFEADKFLPFAQGRISTLSNSTCKAGSLLQAEEEKTVSKHGTPKYTGKARSLLQQEEEETLSKHRKRKYSGWIYVKGLFVYKAPKLMEPINFLNCEVNRDREIVLATPQLIRRIAAIWATRLRYESNLVVEDRIYTRKLVSYSQKRPQLMETQALEYMTYNTADIIMSFLQLAVHRNVFPYCAETQGEAEKITRSLNKHPYACSRDLYSLLQKSKKVLSVKQAQEHAFINAVTVNTDVLSSNLYKMVREFVQRVDEHIEVVVKSGATLNTYMSEGTLYVNENLVTTEVDAKKAINLLTVIEYELMQSVDDGERKRITLMCKEFIASDLFSAYVRGGATAICPPNEIAPEEEEDFHEPLNGALQNIEQPLVSTKEECKKEPELVCRSNEGIVIVKADRPRKRQRTCTSNAASHVEVIDLEKQDVQFVSIPTAAALLKIEDVEDNRKQTAQSIQVPKMPDNKAGSWNIEVKKENESNKKRKYERTTLRLGQNYCLQLVTPVPEKQKSLSFRLGDGGDSCSDFAVIQNTELEIPDGICLQQKDGEDLAFSVSVKRIRQ